MRAAERRKQVRALAAEGLNCRAIGERLGLSLSHVRKLHSRGSSYETSLRMAREAKRRRRGRCVDCGAPTHYNGHGREVSEHCQPCGSRVAGPKLRGRGRTMERVLGMLVSGPMRYSEIRDRLESTNGHTGQVLHRLRKHGLVVRVSRGVYALPGNDS